MTPSLEPMRCLKSTDLDMSRYVLPGLAVTKQDLLLLLLNVLQPHFAKFVLHVLDGLMVDAEEKVDFALIGPCICKDWDCGP